MKRIKSLSAAQKKAVWAEPTSNAGVGWHPTGADPFDGHPSRWPYREPERERDLVELLERGE